MTTHSAGVVDFKDLIPGSLLDVETKSRHYRIECLGGNSVRISGHPEYCPEPVPAQLQGSIDKEGVLELDHIEPGMQMMLFLDGVRPLRTSKVVRVNVSQPKPVH